MGKQGLRDSGKSRTRIWRLLTPDPVIFHPLLLPLWPFHPSLAQASRQAMLDLSPSPSPPFQSQEKRLPLAPSLRKSSLIIPLPLLTIPTSRESQLLTV